MKYYMISENEVTKNGCDCGEPYCTILSKAKLVDLDEAVLDWVEANVYGDAFGQHRKIGFKPFSQFIGGK
jgi:hypothetical protein